MSNRLHFLAHALMILIAIIPGHARAGTLPVPYWSMPTSISTDDGYAELAWATGGTGTVSFFRLTEVHEDHAAVHFVDHPTTHLYRIQPGVYIFQVQACERDPDGYPSCGGASSELELTVTDKVNTGRGKRGGNQDPPGQSRSPAGFTPGRWHNPDRPGHGWSFFWKSRLALPENDPLYGDAWDLIGIWYTYEAKNRYRNCGACPWIYEDYKPVFARMDLTEVSSQQYAGTVTITRSGTDYNVGDMTVDLGQDSDEADLNWNADFLWQSIVGSDAIALLVEPSQNPVDNPAHYSGMWDAPAPFDYRVAHALGWTSEAIEVVFEDEEGHPSWIMAAGDDPVPGHTDLCYVYVSSGFPPGTTDDFVFYENGCDADMPSSANNRNGFRRFTGFESEQFWVDFDLPGGTAPDEFVAGSAGYPHNLTKSASFHRIEYDSPAGSNCQLVPGDECTVALTWFTDHNFPQTSAFAHNTATGARAHIATSMVEQDYEYCVGEAGAWEFELRMGDSADSALMGLSDLFSVSGQNAAACGAGGPETPPDPAPPPDMTPDASSSEVGVTLGAFAVSPTGSATYRIPILSGPGSGGLAPAIALAYDSQGGNGPVGAGWGIDGFSMISRCSQTIEQDAVPANLRISFSTADRFCLDGERLMAVNGAYGADGTEYRKERDDFTRVVSYGNGSDGPDYFKAWSREGVLYEFGRSPDSRVETRTPGIEGVAFAWAQNRLEDTAGNYIKFEYSELSQGPVDFVLETIRYTGNDAAGVLPYAELRFTYGTRSDRPVTYMAGAAARQSRLLERIDSLSRVDDNAALEYLRSYRLDYGVDGWGRAVLETLTECRDPTAAVCFEPTTFEWLKTEHHVTPNGPDVHQLFTADFRGLALGDVSGDGRPDLLITERDGQDFEFAIATGSQSGDFTLGPDRFTIPSGQDPGQPVPLTVIDLNADGYQDVLLARETAGVVRWHARLAGPSGLGSEFVVLDDCCDLLQPALLQVMDFNGDGLGDIMTNRPTNLFEDASEIVVLINDFQPGDAQPMFQPPLVIDVNYPELFPSSTPGGWVVADEAPAFGFQTGRALPGRVDDFYGDGSADILVRLSRWYKHCTRPCPPNRGGGGEPANSVFIFDEEEHLRAPPSPDPLETWALASFYLVFFADEDGDYSTYELIARGAGDDCAVPDVCNPYFGLPWAKRTQPADLNADGLADVVYLDDQYDWYYRINSGTGFVDAELIGTPPDDERAERALFVDVSGDGYPELLYPDLLENDSATWMVQFNDLGEGFSAPQISTMPVGNTLQGDTSVMLDFTGDGMLDQLFIDWRSDGNGAQSGTTKVRRGENMFSNKPGEAVNVIKAIEDGFGARHEIRYAPLTDPDVHSRMNDSANAAWGRGSVVYDLSVPFYLVFEVEVSAPVFGNVNQTAERFYHYAGAKLQAGGRGFLGFAEIVEFDFENSLRTNTRYRQDFPFTGLITDQSIFLSNYSYFSDLITDISSQSISPWPIVGALTTLPPHQAHGVLIRLSIHEWNAVEITAGMGAWVVKSPAEVSREFSLEGHFKAKALTTRVFDQYANITDGEERRYETDTTVVWSRVTTQNTWLNDITRWRLGNLDSTQVTHWRANSGGSILRQSSFAYDPQSSLLRQETNEPGDPNLQVSTAYTLDPFGNRLSTTLTGIGMAPRSSESVYDTLGRFVVQQRNAYGQTTMDVQEWDAFGNSVQTLNIDGVLTLSAVDDMGRLFTSYIETGAWSRTDFGLGGHAQCPGGTAYHSVTTGGGQAMSVKCFDRLQRQVRGVTEGFLGAWIRSDSYFDASGRPERVSEPYFAGQSRYWTVSEYDAIGRITRTTGASGLVDEVEYDLAASHCGQTSVRARLERRVPGDGSAQLRWQVDNAVGEPTKVIDDLCGLMQYQYDAVGNLVEVAGVDASVVTISYDSKGLQKTSMSDPDKGFWQYANNALGEVERQLDSKQQAIDFEYDLMGRVTHRRELSEVSSLGDTSFVVENHEIRDWQNGTTGSLTGRAQLVSEEYREGEAGAVINQREYGYDNFGRDSQVDHLLESQPFTESRTYDEFGRVFQQFDASGEDQGVRVHYNERGYLEKLQEARDGEAGAVYQQILAMDPRGNLTAMDLGNGSEAFATYDPASGFIERLEAYDANGQEMQFAEYGFDRLGNLNWRHDRSGTNNLREDFAYDDLNRLERILLTAPQYGLNQFQTQSLTYDESGNISYKSGVGGFTYGQGNSGPHAVTYAGGVTYAYDANGNQLSSSDGRNINYGVFDQATRIQSGSALTEFSYGLGNQRFKRLDDNMVDGEKTTWTIGSVELIEADGAAPLFKRYIGGVAIVDYTPSSGATEAWYLAKDHLGSIHSISDEDGFKVQEAHFGPWGSRRQDDWQSPLDTSAAQTVNGFTPRGFTGHEHADGLGIIHMNGRIYDPRLSRFLQADPIVQAPRNSQNLNRYSYVLNNPLSYTDPSGYFLKRLIKRWGRVIVAAAVGYWTFGATYGLAASGVATAASQSLVFAQFIGAVGWQAVAGVVAGAASGLVAGAILTGSLRGAVKSAFAGAITYGLNKFYGNQYNGRRVISESIAGGVNAKILGGKFEQGLSYALIVSGLNYANYRMDLAERNQSAKNSYNLNKPGSGLFGHEFSITGARRTVDPVTGQLLPCESTTGGCQGLPILSSDQPNELFGFPVDPKSPVGYTMDAFAGPHDWLRNHVSRSYTPDGNSKYLVGSRGVVDAVANILLVPVAAPFALATIVQTVPTIWAVSQFWIFRDEI